MQALSLWAVMAAICLPACQVAVAAETMAPLEEQFESDSGLVGSIKMPAIGLGTWQSAPGKVRAAVKHAILSGYRHIDCARAYGNEEEVGAGIRDALSAVNGSVGRKDLWVTTKVMPTDMHVGRVYEAVTASLQDLQLDYVDLVLLHWPCAAEKSQDGSIVPLGYDKDRIVAVWRELERLVNDGKVRFLGVSNFSTKKLKHFLDVFNADVPPTREEDEWGAGARMLEEGTAPLTAPIAVNQVERHPFLQQPTLKAFCDEHNIVLTGYSPLGSPDRPSRHQRNEDPVPMAHPVIKDIAARLGRSPAQVLLRWAVQDGTVAIPKSVNPSRIEENLRVFDFELGEEDMESLRGLDQGWRLIRGQQHVREELGERWEDLWDGDAEVPAGDTPRGSEEL